MLGQTMFAPALAVAQSNLGGDVYTELVLRFNRALVMVQGLRQQSAHNGLEPLGFAGLGKIA